MNDRIYMKIVGSQDASGEIAGDSRTVSLMNPIAKSSITEAMIENFAMAYARVVMGAPSLYSYQAWFVDYQDLYEG